MYRIYGIRSCDSCRKARKWLDEYACACEFHDVREDGLQVQVIERWCKRIAWEELLNTRSLTWRRIPEVDRADMSRSRAISLMLENPTLIKRPVLECKEFIAVGFSPERYEELFAREPRA